DSMLCRYRALAGISPVTTAILTEEEVRDFNALRLGSGIRCGNAETALVPFYPEDTLLMRRSFVRLDWGDRLGRQVRQADRFGDWLVHGDGRELLEVTAEEPEPVGATEVGTEPDSALVERVESKRRQVNPKGRILVLLDTSGSMEQSAGRSPDGGPDRGRQGRGRADPGPDDRRRRVRAVDLSGRSGRGAGNGAGHRGRGRRRDRRSAARHRAGPGGADRDRPDAVAGGGRRGRGRAG